MRSAPFVEPDPFKGVLGPSVAGKRPKTDQNVNLDLSFLLRPIFNFVLFPPPPGGSGGGSGLSLSENLSLWADFGSNPKGFNDVLIMF